MKQKIRSFVEMSSVNGIPYTLLKASQEYGPGNDQAGTDSIVMFPKIGDETKNIIDRLNWYLPHNNNKYSVWVSTSEEYNDHLDEEQSYNISINYVSDQYRLYQLVNKCSDILIHNAQSFLNPYIMMNISNTTVIDPEWQKESELDNWMEITEKYYDLHTSPTIHSFSNLENAFAEHNQSYIFAPGPSLSKVFDYNIDHSTIKFVCNDILLYDEIIEYIRPNVIVLFDPVFFGPSEYAQKIRTAAAEIIDTYDAYLIAPNKVTGLLYDRLQGVSKKIIGLEVSSMSGKQLPGTLNERVDTGTVVPSKMLPIASALTEEVAIFGADGYGNKTLSESYFHSSTVQYRRDSISKWHPGHPLHKDNYMSIDELNQKNNLQFSKWISAGRASGVRYYSITESNYSVLEHIKSDHKEFFS